MKQGLRLITTSVVMILFSISPADALFGSECKKPKATYAQYQSSSKSLQKQEARERELEAQEYRLCLKNPKAFFLEKKITNRKNSCELWKLLDRVPVTPREKTAFKEYKNSMLIVKSYKKCFDPGVYIDATQWLKANPK